MARLENYPEAVRNHLLKLPCPTFDSTPFNRPIPMKEQRVALVSTAGLHLRGDRPFGIGDADHQIVHFKSFSPSPNISRHHDLR